MASFVSDQIHPGPSCTLCGATMQLICPSCGNKEESIPNDPGATELTTLREENARLKKYEALYAEARESLCSCNLTDTPEKGPEYNYTCEWCKEHPEGAECPPVIKRLWLAEEENARLREALGEAMEWAAKYPLHGDGSESDRLASAHVYNHAKRVLEPARKEGDL